MMMPAARPGSVERDEDLPERSNRRRAQARGGTHVIEAEGTHRPVQWQHHERQHDVHHADCRSGEVVHELQGSIDDADIGQPPY